MGSQERYQNWADEANEDWKTSKVLFEAGRYNACVFYCQQTAEKSLKSLLLKLQIAPWGHSTWNLFLDAAEACNHHDFGVEQAAKGLDLHYAPSRYPDALPSGSPSMFYDKDKAEEAMEWARAVMEYVKCYL